MRNKILKTLKGFPECSYKRNMFLKMLVYYEFRETESKSKTLTLFACYHYEKFYRIIPNALKNYRTTWYG